MSSASNLNNGMSAAEKASEKYLGQSYLKDLNVIAPSIGSEKLALLMREANSLMEHCNQKYSLDILNSQDTFKKQINTILQVVEIDADQAKINALSFEIQDEINSLSEKLVALNKALNPLSEIYTNEDYINNIIPNELDQARLIPRIMGVVQIATLKRETIQNAIAQAKAIENELIHFSDTTMFQIREGLRQLGDTGFLRSDVERKVSKKLAVTEKTLGLSLLTNTSSLFLILGSVIFGIIGLPLPSNTMGVGASFVFVFFILSLSLIFSSFWMYKKKNDETVLYGEQYAKLAIYPLVSGIVGFIATGGYIIMSSNEFDFYQLLPMFAIGIFLLGGFLSIIATLAAKHIKKEMKLMRDYKQRLAYKKTAD